ncbi:TetR/AcrR family transcriptional regulator [Streptomyces sp. NRRL F-5123]|uniref:TetR/AcrR family transcriptional regulator n=1 Tax=Streptomyces sp. NRRL F-5123 TaxID=1463856 RepID=UPI0004E2525A|nr:TetR/AcrR family transcriptional regulator [Streptomyces sp. NRRL F-5123]
MADSRHSAHSPRARQIVGAARELLEKEGADALTMRHLADRIGIKAPSLYKHFRDKAAVEAELTALMLAELAETLEAAEAEAPGSLAALLGAYRAYALEHPNLYRLSTQKPLPRGVLPPGLEDRAAAPLFRHVRMDEHTARAAWAFAHGMVVLELDGRFPDDSDLAAAWRTGADAFSP